MINLLPSIEGMNNRISHEENDVEVAGGWRGIDGWNERRRNVR